MPCGFWQRILVAPKKKECVDQGGRVQQGWLKRRQACRLRMGAVVAAFAGLFTLDAEPALTSENKLSTGVPEEFLDLLDPSEAESTGRATASDGQLFVDFYADGIRRGDILVTLENNRLTFENPSRIIDLIDDLKNAESFKQRLSAGFDLDGKEACRLNGVRVCSPPRLGRFGVLIDSDALRVDVYRSNRFKKPPPPMTPTHPNDLGLVAALTGRVSGSYDGRDIRNNASLSYDAVTGIGARSVFANGFIDQRGDISVYQAGAQMFRDRYRIAAGILVSESSEFFSQQDLLGGEIHTTNIANNIAVETDDTPVLIFLDRPSYVDVFRDGQLLHSSYAEAGPYRVPTAKFPPGSYDIQVRIRGDDGSERTEDRFFARVNSVRQRDYSFQAGRTRERGSTSQFAASEDGLPYLAARASQPFGLTEVASARIGLLDRTGFIEASASGYGDGVSWRATALGTSEGGFGIATQLSGSKYGVNFSARGRYSDIDTERHSFRRSALGRNAEANMNVSAPVPIVGGWVSGFGRYINRSGSNGRTSHGVTWNRPLAYFGRANSVQMSLSYQDTGRDKRIDIRLRLARTQGRSTVSGTLGLRHTRSERGLDPALRPESGVALVRWGAD